MKKVFLIALSLLLAGCTPADDTPAPTEGATSIPTEAPTFTEAPASVPVEEHLIGIVTGTEITLGSRGWENIRSTAGYPDFEEWNYTVTEPQDGVEIAATIWGTVDGLYDNTITAVVEIVVSDEYPEGKIYKVCYLSGREVTSDFFGVGETEILDAHNEDLWHYMYSY